MRFVQLNVCVTCRQGVLVVGVCNVVGSTIARETDAGVYLHAGPEIGVASTKAFTAQVAVLSMIAISIGVSNGTISSAEGDELGRALLRIPAAVEQCIASCSSICKQVAAEYWLADNFLFLGRAIHYPVALEGALKLKEISYIHAEGLPAAEMKHGHIALVDNRMPVVVIAQKDSKIFEKIVSNIQEVQARGGRVICVCSDAGDHLQRLCEHIILVPSVHPLLDALITVGGSRMTSHLFSSFNLLRECCQKSRAITQRGCRLCRCSSSPTTSPSSAAPMSTSLETSRRASPWSRGPLSETKQRSPSEIKQATSVERVHSIGRGGELGCKSRFVIQLKKSVTNAIIEHLQQTSRRQQWRGGVLGGAGRLQLLRACQAQQLRVAVAQHEPKIAALTLAQLA